MFFGNDSTESEASLGEFWELPASLPPRTDGGISQSYTYIEKNFLPARCVHNAQTEHVHEAFLDESRQKSTNTSHCYLPPLLRSLFSGMQRFCQYFIFKGAVSWDFLLQVFS
jgi:hypothetical protein